MKKIPVNIRFWSKVKKTRGCWIWKGCTVKGYGRIGVDGKNINAHRYAFQEVHGPIPDGKMVLHTCIKTRACVNPKHLYLGTYSDNTRDSCRVGTFFKVRLNPNSVRRIRKLAKNPRHNEYTISDKFGVDRKTIRDAINRKTWGWINFISPTPTPQP